MTTVQAMMPSHVSSTAGTSGNLSGTSETPVDERILSTGNMKNDGNLGRPVPESVPVGNHFSTQRRESEVPKQVPVGNRPRKGGKWFPPPLGGKREPRLNSGSSEYERGHFATLHPPLRTQRGRA